MRRTQQGGGTGSHPLKIRQLVKRGLGEKRNTEMNGHVSKFTLTPDQKKKVLLGCAAGRQIDCNQESRGVARPDSGTKGQ